VAVVLDARDNAFEPNRGVLVEGGVFTGTGGDGYAGGYAIASGFANPAFGTVLAARLGGRSMSSDAPLTARFGIPAWEREVPMLGGPGSHRSLAVGRFAGHSALFGSLELRQVIIDAGDMAGVYGLLFLDAGRVFEGDAGVDAPSSRESFRLTTEDLKVGGGVGVAIRLLRANIFSTSVATGPDGVKVMVGSGWMF
jgi:outer membrane protein assembly factor BamA